LEKYSLRHAVTYDYFYDQWKVVKDLSAIIPSKELKMNESYLDKNRNVELKDTAYHYFLHVEDYLGEGKVKPLDFAREEIKEILINLKRVNFIQQVKDELYKDASEDNRINYYYLDSNE
jgi:predicted SprT family Zn-dependent metalloprotease